METLSITKENALTAYKEANEKGKTLLVNLFGKETFAKARFSSYKDIKTFEDAMEYLGAEDALLKEYAAVHALVPADVKAYYKLRIIAKAINGGVVMNDSDKNVVRYYPFFNATESNSGFSYGLYYGWSSITYVPSRLCFLDSDRSIYAGKQFTDIYKDFLA